MPYRAQTNRSCFLGQVSLGSVGPVAGLGSCRLPFQFPVLMGNVLYPGSLGGGNFLRNTQPAFFKGYFFMFLQA